MQSQGNARARVHSPEANRRRRHGTSVMWRRAATPHGHRQRLAPTLPIATTQLRRRHRRPSSRMSAPSTGAAGSPPASSNCRAQACVCTQRGLCMRAVSFPVTPLTYARALVHTSIGSTCLRPRPEVGFHQGGNANRDRKSMRLCAMKPRASLQSQPGNQRQQSTLLHLRNPGACRTAP